MLLLTAVASFAGRGFLPAARADEALSGGERQALWTQLSQADWLAASGAGAWEGRLKIAADGAFTGHYHDADMDTLYQVDFSGAFGNAVRVSDTVFRLEVLSAATQDPPRSTGRDEYGDLITYMDSLLPAGSQWLLTLPGTPDTEIPEMVQEEIGGTLNEWQDYSRFLTLTQAEDGWGFFAESTAPVEMPQIGGTVYWGRYEQDNNTWNGKERIAWTVLDIRDGKALLISRYGLDCQPYNKKLEDVTWENSSIRSWLNDQFYNNAFSADEQSAIILTHVDNSKAQIGSVSADPGKDTTDRLFLLSALEADTYFSNDRERCCEPTLYAQEQGVYTGLSVNKVDGKWMGAWWLRTPGYFNIAAAKVLIGGVINYQSHVITEHTAIRPACWVDLSAMGYDAASPASAPAAAPTQAPQSGALLPIPGKAGYMQVPVRSADATSWIEGKDPAAYAPFRMIDGEETTSFQFSTKTTKLGKEYLYFDFDAPVTVDELWMKNGFWKITDGKDQYSRNSRVKKMTLSLRYAGSDSYQELKTVTLKDDKARKDWKVITLGHQTAVTGVRIRIDAIFTGSKYKNDVCISEIMFVQETR